MLFDQMFRNIATQPGGPPSFLTGDQTAYSPQTPQPVAGPANPMDYGMQQPQQPQGPQMGFGMPAQGYDMPQQNPGMPGGDPGMGGMLGNLFGGMTPEQRNYQVIGLSPENIKIMNSEQQPQQQPGMPQPGYGQQVVGPVNPNNQYQSNF
jgi:hypothetical protein